MKIQFVEEHISYELFKIEFNYMQMVTQEFEFFILDQKRLPVN